MTIAWTALWVFLYIIVAIVSPAAADDDPGSFRAGSSLPRAGLKASRGSGRIASVRSSTAPKRKVEFRRPSSSIRAAALAAPPSTTTLGCLCVKGWLPSWSTASHHEGCGVPADDQNRVAQSKSNADAFAGRRWLLAQTWVDPGKIIVMGMSRGGEAAYSAALDVLRKRMQVGNETFAAHIAIAMGSCNFPQRDVRTTGGPIFFMLGELDENQRVAPCVEYIERMRKAGKATVRVAVYPGVYHGYEGTAGAVFAPDDWASAECGGRFDRDENFLLYHRGTGQRITQGSQTEYLFKTCLKRGYVVGGDQRVKAQATADLLQFLRDAGVLSDEAARAVVPDCAKLPEHVRLNCARATAGWTGDLVALARALRGGTEVPRDAVLAVKLLELASARGNPHAQWELAVHLRQGSGTERDLQRALTLARASADAGDAAGMNVYGVMVRDGTGRPRDDAEALVWFQRSADLLNTYGMVNLGRFYNEGRGGLSKDPAAAVALWRTAVLKG